MPKGPSLKLNLLLQGVWIAIVKTLTPAPLLWELKFQERRFGILDGTLPHEFPFFGKRSPLLRSIHFDTYPQFSPPFSLPHLTNLELPIHFSRLMLMGTLLELLSSAPHLRSFSICLSRCVVETEVDRDQVTLLEDRHGQDGL